MMSKRNSVPLLVSLLLAGLLSACASSQPAPASYDPEREARIRVFHGPSVYIYLGNACDGRSHPVIHAAAGGFSYAIRNRRIGMPVAEDTPWSFNEYTVPAGEPLTVKMYWQAQNHGGVWTHCGPIHVTFIPDAGHDYEAFMKFRGSLCQGVEIRKLVVDADGRVETAFAPLNSPPFYRCQ